MARRGWSTSNFLRLGRGVVTATPLTIAAWARTSITGTDQDIVDLQNSASTTLKNRFGISISPSNVLQAEAADGSGGSSANTSTAITANVWFHACGVFTSATNRTAYLNGGGAGTASTSKVPSGINRTSIGVRDASTAATPFAPAGTGDIAEVTIWNIALAAADVAALANGIHPFLVHPEAIVACWPLMGVNSPENELKSNTNTMSIQGSLSQSAHCRIFRPINRRNQHLPLPFTVTAVAGAYTLSGVAALFPVARKVVAVAGAYTLSGVAALFPLARKVVAVAGAYTLSGVAALFHLTWHMTMTAGSYTLTGVSATLTRGVPMTAAAGVYILSGVSAALNAALKMAAVAGSYTLSGVAAILNKGNTLTAAVGAYVLTGVAASFHSVVHIAASTGTYVLTGKDVVLSWVVFVGKFLKRRVSAPVLQLLRATEPSLRRLRSVNSPLTKLRAKDPTLED